MGVGKAGKLTVWESVETGYDASSTDCDVDSAEWLGTEGANTAWVDVRETVLPEPAGSEYR